MSRRSQHKDARKRLKQKGRSAGTFFQLPHYIMKSEEFGALPPWSLKLLLELSAQYNGFNNGDMSAAYTILRKRGWNSPGTLAAALKELRTTGWITQTRQGGRNRCSLYAVTWWPIDECNGKLECSAEASPRHEWKKSKPLVSGCSNLQHTATTKTPERFH